ncbi:MULTISPECIES: Crp/Fnr family transcriptional regulator [Cyanophyceae]|uniref:Crp/Fnr family transcriptional regulator n=1 Tax=Leptolyngbya subtilissima DQ-A4 TaxID=2933933 RepID=A0ABV0KBJ0_9CYAN|nr:Crp/Fnr family transcriptional regulator [Nodosilinea sp. FACHB-141]MBD2115083.1 Crp/Fnr family transcriptional regulator [Nodosilinea sp. FACHB-141]
MYEPFYTFILKIFPEFGIDPTLLDPFLKDVEVKKGDFLFQQGDICNFIGFTLKGCVRVFLIKDEKERTLSFHAENQSFGDFRSFLNQEPSEFSCEVIERSRIILFDHRAMQLIEKLPDGQKFLRLHAEAFASKMRDKLTSLYMDTPEERYCKLLDNEPEIIDRVSNYHLASYLGIQPESLSRLKRRIYQRRVS